MKLDAALDTSATTTAICVVNSRDGAVVLETSVTTDPDDSCIVLSGTLDDPYTGEVITFERGEHSSAVQIDHVVALSDAWQKGAQQWSAETREQFANDPANLLAVDGPANQQKGAGDALGAGWAFSAAKTSFTSGLPFPSSPPTESTATRGWEIRMTSFAYAAAITAYCTRWIGLHWMFAPTSITTQWPVRVVSRNCSRAVRPARVPVRWRV